MRLVLALLLSLGGLALVACSPSPQVVAVGQQGHLQGKQSGPLTVSRDIAADDALTKVLEAQDQAGLDQLIAQGKVFAVSSGASVLVLEYRADGRTHVRILDGPKAQADGWVPTEWLTR